MARPSQEEQGSKPCRDCPLKPNEMKGRESMKKQVHMHGMEFLSRKVEMHRFWPQRITHDTFRHEATGLILIRTENRPLERAWHNGQWYCLSTWTRWSCPELGYTGTYLSCIMDCYRQRLRKSHDPKRP